MNVLALFSSDLDQLCARVSLTLLHSLWEFGLLTVGVAILSRLFAARNPERGHALHVAALLLGLAALPVTLAMVQRPRMDFIGVKYLEVKPATATQPAVMMRAEDLPPDFTPTPAEAPPAVAPEDLQILETQPHGFDWLQLARWLSTAYALGVALMLARLSWNIWRCQRLTARCETVTAGPMAELLHSLACQWSLRVVPRLALAERIVVPQVVGLLRPTILLPASAVTGLTPSELEMILAHELAHVRRWDMWVNLVQRLAEAVLFFNPALWYLSRRISTLREYCCDEQTCSVSPHAQSETRLRYAQALLRVVELSNQCRDTPGLAVLAASGRNPSELRRRVARLFGEPLREPVRLSRSGLVVLLGALALLFVWPLVWPLSADQQDKADSNANSSGTPLAEFKKSDAQVTYVALGTYIEEPEQWWDEKGDALDSVPFEWKGKNNVSSNEKVWRKAVFCIENLPAAAEVTWQVRGAGATGDASVQLTPTSSMTGMYFTKYFGMQDGRNTVDLLIGIATGEWSTLVKSKVHMGSFGIRNNSVMFSQAVSTPEGTSVVVTHNVTTDCRVVAFDKKGQKVYPVGQPGVGGRGFMQLSLLFAGLKPEEIDRFEFQTREYEWVEIKDLPVKAEGASESAGLEDFFDELRSFAATGNAGLRILSSGQAARRQNLQGFAKLGKATYFEIDQKPVFWQAIRNRVDGVLGYENAFDGVLEGLLRDPHGPHIDIRSTFDDYLAKWMITVSSEPGKPNDICQLFACSVRNSKKSAEVVRRLIVSDPRVRSMIVNDVQVYFIEESGQQSACCLVNDWVLVADDRDFLVKAITVLKPQAPEDAFSLAPVTTELQRRLLHNDLATVYLNINGDEFFPKARNDDRQKQLAALIESKLKRLEPNEKQGTLYVRVDGDSQDVHGREELQPFLDTWAEAVGFKDATGVCSTHNDPDYAWEGFTHEPSDLDAREPAVKAGKARIYVVKTALSRHLAGDVDCYIELVDPLPAESENLFPVYKEVAVRKALEKMEFGNRGIVKVAVNLERPPDHKVGAFLPQQEKDSPFQLSAAELLLDAGFKEVVIIVADGGTTTVGSYVAGEDGPHSKSAEKSASNADHEILIRTVDAEGKPLIGAKVFSNLRHKMPGAERAKIDNLTVYTDDRGEAKIPLPGKTEGLRIWARQNGYVPRSVGWDDEDVALIPAVFEFPFVKGTKIGGIVHDTAGAPIEGVKVEVEIRPVFSNNPDSPRKIKRPGGDIYLAYGSAGVYTDAEGKWTLDNVPTDEKLLAPYEDANAQDAEHPLQIRYSHPEYETIDGIEHYPEVPNPRLEDLRKFQALADMKWVDKGDPARPNVVNIADANSHAGEDLHGRTFSQQHDLVWVGNRLNRANLTRAVLRDVELGGGGKSFFETDFSGAELRDSRLSAFPAGFQQANFTGATIDSTSLTGGDSGFQRASFDKTTILNSQLGGGTSAFQEATFRNADLKSTAMYGKVSSFQQANFDGAKLFRVAFWCKGSPTAFQGVSLNNTEFRECHLETISAESLRSCQFDPNTPPRYDARTKFPEEFDPKEAGWKLIVDEQTAPSATEEQAHTSESSTEAIPSSTLVVHPLSENLEPAPSAYLTLWREAAAREEIRPHATTWTDRDTGVVWIRERSAHPNDGRHGKGERVFRFENLAPARYYVTAASYDPKSRTPDPTPFGVSEVVIVSKQRAADEPLNVVMRGNRSLTVRVLDEKTGEAVNGMGLRLYNSRGVPIVHGHGSGNFFERTSEAGEVYFRHLPPNVYTVDILGKQARVNEFVEYEPFVDSLRIHLTGPKNNPQTLTYNAPPHRLIQEEIDKRFPFSAYGRVTDEDGKPLAGVTVRAATGVGTLLGGGSAVTDDQGKYRLHFGPGMHTMLGKDAPLGVGVQAALISARKSGWYETNLSRQGDFAMTDNDPQEMQRRIDRSENVWGKKSIDQLVFPHAPREVNFTMAPAATIQGKLVSGGSRELEDEKLYFTGDQLPPGCSVLRSIVTGHDGEFVVEDVPVGYAWRFGMRVDNTRQEVETEPFRINEAGNQHCLLSLDSEKTEDGQVALKLSYHPQPDTTAATPTPTASQE